MKWLKMKSWNPYVVGALIGVLSMFTFYTANKPLGVSTAFSNATVLKWGALGKLTFPQTLNLNPWIVIVSLFALSLFIFTLVAKYKKKIKA